MIKIEVDQGSIKYVERKLGELKKKAPVVIARSLNKTATTARQKLATQTKSVYTYDKSVRSQMEIYRASSGNLTARIFSMGKPHNATSFSHSSSKKSGVKLAQLCGGGKNALIGSRGIMAWKDQSKGGAKGGILQREGKERYPIKFISGSSTPKMIENEKVYGVKEKEIGETLKKNIENQIKLLVG